MRNTWSAFFASMPHSVARPAQAGQIPKPPPGFRQAAPWFDFTVRSNQPHWPALMKSSFACTETQ
jgi:hypothetical protein